MIKGKWHVMTFARTYVPSQYRTNFLRLVRKHNNNHEDGIKHYYDLAILREQLKKAQGATNV